MIARSAGRAGIAALVCAAAVVATAGAAPASAARASGSHQVGVSYKAFAFSRTTGTNEPVIDKFIASAHRSLDMTMYELDDTTAIKELIALHDRGVAVRVILDNRNESYNAPAFAQLQAAGVGVVYSNPTYYFTHQKTITVDGAVSLIMTGNLTSEYYTTSRDYGVFDNDHRDVAAIETVFNADFTHTAVTPGDGDNLLWSPTDSRARILTVINGAKRTLDVEELEFSDSAVVDAITAAAKRGVKVRIVLENPSYYTWEIAQVEAAGATVTSYDSQTGLYIHAKAIVADAGTHAERVEVGSINITENSLDNNRELGIILTDHSSVNLIESYFKSDFAGGAPAA